MKDLQSKFDSQTEKILTLSIKEKDLEHKLETQNKQIEDCERLRLENNNLKSSLAQKDQAISELNLAKAKLEAILEERSNQLQIVETAFKKQLQRQAKLSTDLESAKFQILTLIGATEGTNTANELGPESNSNVEELCLPGASVSSLILGATS